MGKVHSCDKRNLLLIMDIIPFFHNYNYIEGVYKFARTVIGCGLLSVMASKIVKRIIDLLHISNERVGDGSIIVRHRFFLPFSTLE